MMIKPENSDDNKIMCHLKFPGGSIIPVRPIRIQHQRECIKKYTSNCPKSNLYNVILCTLGDHFTVGEGSVSKLFLGGIPLTDLINAFMQDYTLYYGRSRHFNRLLNRRRRFYTGIGKWNLLDISDIVVNEVREPRDFAGKRDRIKNVPVWGIYLMYKLMLFLVRGEVSIGMLGPIKLAIEQAVKEMKTSIDYSLEPVSVESTEYDLRFHTRNMFNIYLFDISIDPEAFVHVHVRDSKYLPIITHCMEEKEVKTVKEEDKKVIQIIDDNDKKEEEEEENSDDRTVIEICEQIVNNVADTEDYLTELMEALNRKCEDLEKNVYIKIAELEDRMMAKIESTRPKKRKRKTTK